MFQGGNGFVPAPAANVRGDPRAFCEVQDLDGPSRGADRHDAEAILHSDAVIGRVQVSPSASSFLKTGWRSRLTNKRLLNLLP
jgi:hypothetical protein